MDRTAEPSVFVVFGATGDLFRRKLAPALLSLQRDGLLPPQFAVCAYARRELSDDTFRAFFREALLEFSPHPPGAEWEQLARRVFYVRGEIDDALGYSGLRHRLAQIDQQLGTRGNRLFYLAVAPEFSIPIVEHLGRSKQLLKPRHRRFQFNSGRHHLDPWQRIVLEKPIGTNLASARELLKKVARFAAEEQTFRIDHYLGKETVQNILALRFGNCIFEPVWNRNYIEHVQITVAEAEGVGTRAGYYDDSGALRDMLESHMLQLLCLVAMEAPGALNPDDVRNEKAKVLRALRRIEKDEVAHQVVRGQYGPDVEGTRRGYRQEPGVAPNSNTDTYVALRCHVETWRWSGVPFLLRTGKALGRRQTEISIHFRQPPLRMFGYSQAQPPCSGNVLALHIQPNEGLGLEMVAKVPASRMLLNTVLMDFTYKEAFKRESPDAYQRLILDAINGDATLFKRSDEVLAEWEFCDPILQAWGAAEAPEFPNYAAGSWGPVGANRLLPTCESAWHLERPAPRHEG